jgi:hypothetical protein
MGLINRRKYDEVGETEELGEKIEKICNVAHHVPS